MQDRPTVDELLAAIEHFLDDVVAESAGAQRFNARVAANTLRIVRRELAQEEEQLHTELDGLERLLGSKVGAANASGHAAASSVQVLREEVAARTEDLCRRIRRGDADTPPARDAVRAHVRATVENKLRITNPRWLPQSRESVP